MESGQINIYSFKFKDPDLRSLRDLVSQMHPVYIINFGKNYGNLLNILNQQVDYTALITLAQFYDLPLRCFTFQDFQLAPTLEEFERLVRIPMKNKKLFKRTDESLPLEEESWDACYSAIALAIYGVVLFPNMDGFVDMTAIYVFLTGNPDLSWYSKEYINVDIIFSCGDFPNLPLIGTQGCVNANPILSLRQLGYPMEGPPEANSLEAFLLLDFGVENPSLFQRIKEAWKNVNRKGKAELGRANGITKEPYFQWVKERVQMINMSFVIRTPIPLPEPKLTHVPIEEMEELKTTMAKLEKENEELQIKLQQTINEKNNMK
ncbi:hypothetical protein KIW84_073679 [Lathyrus oleraceus]|uniref:DUF7745 domain-containing protein n=1 Tax=Pisum sativum TaxID=3888 RepID=A0A9D4VRP0_PEA|nr:hypothetical protein KIW84_073679 [Pisum sativum]